MKWYQWIFYDEDCCQFFYFEGADLYDVNKRAFDYYISIIAEVDCKDYQEFLRDCGEEARVRYTLFDFCKDRPSYIAFEGSPYIDIDFHVIDFGGTA